MAFIPNITVQIDHIIILVPYSQLASPPSWLTDNFTISPGGVHSDGCTENRLVLFQDGTYIELIAFVNDDPAKRKGHRWERKQFGFIDFAITTPTDPAGGDSATIYYNELSKRIAATASPAAALGIQYLEPIAGGRKKPDGTEIKWKLTIPTLQAELVKGTVAPSVTGAVPFFCHDVTPRGLRVDTSNKQATTHPSAVKGIAQFSVIVPPQKLESYLALYSLILNTRPVRASGTARLDLTAPVKIPGMVKPCVFLEIPELEVESIQLEKRGVQVVDVALRIGSVDGGVGVVRDAVQEEGIRIDFLR